MCIVIVAPYSYITFAFHRRQELLESPEPVESREPVESQEPEISEENIATSFSQVNETYNSINSSFADTTKSLSAQASIQDAGLNLNQLQENIFKAVQPISGGCNCAVDRVDIVSLHEDVHNDIPKITTALTDNTTTFLTGNHPIYGGQLVFSAAVHHPASPAIVPRQVSILFCT
jgi:hypothetical protein